MKLSNNKATISYFMAASQGSRIDRHTSERFVGVVSFNGVYFSFDTYEIHTFLRNYISSG